MKKKALSLIIVLMMAMGISAAADTSSQYCFDNYETVSDVVPGRLFSMYTKTTPELFEYNGVKCLKIDSGDNADNILLMNTNSFTDGGFSVEFSLTADSAPKVNWGLAPHVIIRYKNVEGEWINDVVAEYAYSLVRVKDNGKEVKAGDFLQGSFNDFKFNITRKENIFKAVYQVGENEYIKEYETCDDGEICIGFFSYLGNALYLKDIAYTETYSKGPSAEMVKEDFSKTNPSHPRLLIDEERLGNIKTLVKSDERVKLWYKTVKENADSALLEPVSTYELRDGERLLYVARDVYANSVYPAFVYLIEGEEKYLNRTWAELSAAAKFEDWHPAHFLDTAEMTFAFALCYDWLYDYWTAPQKEVLKTAIKEKGLDAAYSAYENNAEYDSSVYGAYHNRIGWKNDATNWGLVCNGAVAAAAMAIMSEADTDYCAEILEDALFGTEKPVFAYTSEGAWPEGVGYWHYATQYLAYMMSSMENTLGNTYGYMDTEGIRQAANYLIAHTGAKGTFNYGDCTEDAISAPELFYFANYYNDGAIAKARLGMMDRFNFSASLDDILFYKPENVENNTEFSKSYKSDSVGVVTATNSNVSPLASYIGLKAGKVGVSHGDLDAGSFVIDALGVRWAGDYGSDAYTLPGYFDWTTRINYFRKRAEGHSTLVINPDSGADQKVGANAPITYYKSDENGMVTVADLTELYEDDAQSVRRLVSFDGVKFVVQDEVKTKTVSDVYWFMQTNKTVSISGDKKMVILSSGNKRMRMVLESNLADAKFSVMPAKPLSTSPNPDGQAVNNGYLRVCVQCEDVEDLQLKITFIPYIAGLERDIPKTEPFIKIDEEIASEKTGELAMPDKILVNGSELEGFDKLLHYYEIEANGCMPVIKGVSDKYETSVSYGDVTVVTVKDSEGVLGDTKYYFTVSGDVKDDVYAQINENIVNVYMYNHIADVYIAGYDENGKLEDISVFEDAENEVRAEIKSPYVKVFVWNNLTPIQDVINFVN